MSGQLIRDVIAQAATTRERLLEIVTALGATDSPFMRLFALIEASGEDIQPFVNQHTTLESASDAVRALTLLSELMRIMERDLQKNLTDIQQHMN